MDADDLMREHPALLSQWLGYTRGGTATSEGLSSLLALLILKGLEASSVYRARTSLNVKVLDFIKSGGAFVVWHPAGFSLGSSLAALASGQYQS